MTEPAENYTSQIVLQNLKKKAYWLWGSVLFIVAVWVLIILAAPIAKANELIGISNPIYSFYSYICHQIPSRSFHILEHQFAVCSRCFGVYFGLLLGMLIYPLIRSMDEIEPFPRFWLILALVPMVIDWSLTFFGIWENTHFTRVSTGLILGIACAIFIVPALVELSQMLLIRQQKQMVAAASGDDPATG
ncbi:MAG: DUF2085 domain-containing protein [Pyrinomonadaceae bacterium]|nr:DUF2085 domain-containing protein [Pyrinomonadaceae bacterium]